MANDFRNVTEGWQDHMGQVAIQTDQCGTSFFILCHLFFSQNEVRFSRWVLSSALSHIAVTGYSKG